MMCWSFRQQHTRIICLASTCLAVGFGKAAILLNLIHPRPNYTTTILARPQDDMHSMRSRRGPTDGWGGQSQID
jgi:hypothetical protein